jgi:hypothetical protein
MQLSDFFSVTILAFSGFSEVVSFCTYWTPSWSVQDILKLYGILQLIISIRDSLEILWNYRIQCGILCNYLTGFSTIICSLQLSDRNLCNYLTGISAIIWQDSLQLSDRILCNYLTGFSAIIRQDSLKLPGCTGLWNYPILLSHISNNSHKKCLCLDISIFFQFDSISTMGEPKRAFWHLNQSENFVDSPHR